MTKTMGKFACMAFAVLAVAMMFTEPAHAELAKDMKHGTWTEEGGHRWLKFGKYIWRVLKVDVGEALLLTEEIVSKREFDFTKSNDWKNSSIKEWLNERFYNSVFSDAEREAILTTRYRYGGYSDEDSNKTDSSKIFLLSVEEVNNKSYFANVDDRSALFGFKRLSWWLRSPITDRANVRALVSLVPDPGQLNPDGFYSTDVGESYGIRPALYINLSSPIFTSEYEVLSSPR